MLWKHIKSRSYIDTRLEMERRNMLMDDPRKKLRACLVCVVFVAVLVGIFYYYYGIRGNRSSEGTLVREEQVQQCL